MKKLFYLLITLLMTHCLQAQNAIAKINYEQAEEAFEKNDYTLTLAKLDQAQKMLGATNPKILYLRLMAAKGIFATGKFNWDFLAETRTNCAYYLKNYSELAGIEEKLRQVYEFSESLDKHPKTKELFEQKQTEAVQAYAEWLKQRPVQVSDSLMNAFSVNECRTMDAFVSSRFSSDFKKDKRLSTKYETWYFRNNIFTNYEPAGPWCYKFDYSGDCTFYTYIILPKTSDTAAAKKRYQSLIDLYPAELDKEWVEQKELAKGNQDYLEAVLKIKSLATGKKTHFDIFYREYADGAYIEAQFFQ